MKTTKEQFEELIKTKGKQAYYRDCFDPGHITGSCLVVSNCMDYVILMHHKKIDIWTHFGGHCDGQTPYQTAVRELHEESGIKDIKVINKVFDLVIQNISPYKGEPAHKHFDTRYLAFYNLNKKLPKSPENIEYYWFSIDEALIINKTKSMRQILTKVVKLKNERL